MSESEQDALLDRLETKQRGSIKRWVLIAIIAIAAALAGTLLSR